MKLADAQHEHSGRPAHRTATGESASWAGPVDFGRDDAFTGLLVLRGLDAGNVADAVQTDRRGETPFDR